MSKVLVMGPIYAETTVKVSSIPLPSDGLIESNFGITTGFSGHGYNVSRALTKLGDIVNFLSVCGNDPIKLMMEDKLIKVGISNEFIVPTLSETPHTLVLFSDEKTRQIINDLKESYDIDYDASMFEKAIADCDTVVLCNSNYARPYLKRARELGKKIVTDIHAIEDINDEYNKDFMEHADVLCLNSAHLKEPYEYFIKQIEEKYKNEIIILGMGEKGAIMYVRKDNFIGSFPTVRTRKIVNTVGAGDSQLSAFVHFYNKTGNPYYSLKAAILFASYKIGNPRASHGFLTEEQVEVFYHTIWK
jgi:acarbose 7IV-phosphotransferase